MDTLIEVTLLYESLSDNVKDTLAPEIRQRLLSAQQQASVLNHTSGSIQVGNLPWYVKVEAQPIEPSSASWAQINAAVSGYDLISLHDIFLTDLLSNSPWVPDRRAISVSIPMPAIPPGHMLTIAHQKHDGIIEYLPVRMEDGFIVFEASSFSLYGVVTGLIKCNIYFDSRGGSSVEDQQTSYGRHITRPEPPELNAHIFTGWFTDASCTQPFDFTRTAIYADTTLYAGWKPAVQDNGGPVKPPSTFAQGTHLWAIVALGMLCLCTVLMNKVLRRQH